MMNVLLLSMMNVPTPLYTVNSIVTKFPTFGGEPDGGLLWPGQIWHLLSSKLDIPILETRQEAGLSTGLFVGQEKDEPV
jgi:hypothetical protein